MDNSESDNKSNRPTVNGLLITDKLLLRETNRQNECDRKRKEKVNASAETEQASYFKKTFLEKQIEIEEALKALTLDGVDKSEYPTYFDKINKDLVSLQRYIAASTLFLKVYDVRRAQEDIDTLKQTFQQLETDLLPKKKFGFKSRKVNLPVNARSNEVGDSTDSPKDTKIHNPVTIPKPYHFEDNVHGFSDRKGENLTLTNETIFKKDVSLSRLEDCTVQLIGSSSTLTMISLKNCRIFAGPVTTSVFIENCTDCTFVVACQQLRIHTTLRSNFYIHVTSRAIIEDTSQVQFSPYNWSYQDIEMHFQKAGLDPESNHWNSIDDFNWLAVDKPSPNWCLLKEEDRVTDWK